MANYCNKVISKLFIYDILSIKIRCIFNLIMNNIINIFLFYLDFYNFKV